MIETIAELDRTLASWTRAANTPPDCDAIYVRQDAVVGFIIADDSAVAHDRWAAAQSALDELRQRPEHRMKDFYLVFIVHALTEPHQQDLERLLDNPYVCRKLLVEIGDRSVKEALAELGMVLAIDTPSATLRPLIGRDVEGVPHELIDRLARQSPAAVADWLLQLVAPEEESRE
jgi:hypothetical protein